MNIIRKYVRKAGKPLILKDWLGGLDSNQDSQSQSLESYQLDDLPAGRNRKESQHVRLSRQPRFNLSNLIGNAKSVNQTAQFFMYAALRLRSRFVLLRKLECRGLAIEILDDQAFGVCHRRDPIRLDVIDDSLQGRDSSGMPRGGGRRRR